MDVFGDSRPVAQTDALFMMQAVAATENIYHPLISNIGDPINVFQVGLNGTWSTVLSSGLSDPSSRDFFYFGHGGPTSLGVAGTSIASSNVAYQLSNYFPKNNNPLLGPNYHPYRFVFLDGCDTAEGDWPQAFAIPKTTGMNITDFTSKRGIRPRAFMGWNRKKDIGWLNQGVMNSDHSTYITTFWGAWASNDTNGAPFTLQGAIQAAGIETDPSTGNTFPNPQRKGMVLYGAQDLTILQ